MIETIHRIADCLLRHEYRHDSEVELHEAIAQAFTEDGIPFKREVPFGERDRIDFLVEDVAIEVKIAGSLSSVTRQLFRYARLKEIDAVLLVTTRSQLRALPAFLNEKPCAVIYLSPL